MKYFVTGKISENIRETPEGFLICIGVPIARTGEMIYADGELAGIEAKDGKVTISRSEKEVFRPETMASFEGKAITIGHPVDFVSPVNWKSLAVGVMQNVRRGADDFLDSLMADLLITDSLAISLVKNGLRELSCGYEANFTQTGDGTGEQSLILGNHLALVQQGRAGSSYAINDHKGVTNMKLTDKIKSIFQKAQDEAMELAKDADEKEEKKAEGKDADAEEKKKEESKDQGAYDELVKMCKDLGEKIDAMGKSKDQAESPAKGGSGEKEEKAKDDESEGEVSLEERLKKLELAVSQMLEKKAGDEDKVDDEDMDDEGEEIAEDEEMDGEMVGDEASRVEILAPGLSAKGKDFKKKALTTAYATKEGKRVIDAFTGGKAPVLDSAEKVDSLFVAASELLKITRAKELSKTKTTDSDAGESTSQKGPMTAEELNAKNEQFYKRK